VHAHTLSAAFVTSLTTDTSPVIDNFTISIFDIGNDDTDAELLYEMVVDENTTLLDLKFRIWSESGGIDSEDAFANAPARFKFWHNLKFSGDDFFREFCDNHLSGRLQHRATLFVSEKIRHVCPAYCFLSAQSTHTLLKPNISLHTRRHTRRSEIIVEFAALVDTSR
jgi:hypothetical protein